MSDAPDKLERDVEASRGRLDRTLADLQARFNQPGIPRDLETICLKALAPERKRRYVTCEEFASDLERWLQDQPIAARRVTPLRCRIVAPPLMVNTPARRGEASMACRHS